MPNIPALALQLSKNRKPYPGADGSAIHGLCHSDESLLYGVHSPCLSDEKSWDEWNEPEGAPRESEASSTNEKSIELKYASLL